MCKKRSRSGSESERSRLLIICDPAPTHLHCLVPLLEPLLRLFATLLWLEDLAALAVHLLEVIKLLPHAGSKASSNCRTQRGSLAHGGPVDWDATNVGLCLHAQVRVAQTAIDSENLQLLAAVLLHGVEDGLGLEACGLEGSAGDVALLGVLCHAEDGALGRVDPVWCEQTAEGSHKDDATIVRDGLSDLLNLVRLVKEAHVVDEELDTGTRDSDAALERIDGLAARTKVVGDSGQEAVRRDDGFLADIVKDEAASAIGVLGLARLEAALTNECARLIAETASNAGTSERATAKFAKGLRVRGRDNAWESALGGVNVEEAEKFLVVFHSAQVHEHGTAGVGAVGDVNRVLSVDTTIEFVDEPRVDGTKGQAAFIICLLHSRDIVDEPHQLDTAGVGAER